LHQQAILVPLLEPPVVALCGMYWLEIEPFHWIQLVPDDIE
jgi:hypothetical protein